MPKTFPFHKLPGEMRNMIYQFALLANTWGNICIVSHDAESYEQANRAGKIVLRTTYPSLLDEHPRYSYDMSFTGVVIKTTYRSFYHIVDSVGLGLLGTNQQTRNEALSIFFGTNQFHFTDVASLIHFLKDLTPEARNAIRNIHLNLHIHDDGHHQTRHETWRSAFVWVSRNLLSLQNLTLRIFDHDEYLKHFLSSDWSHVRWIAALTRIRNLRELSFELSINKRGIIETDGRLKHDLDCYLRCYMLKDRTEEHAQRAKDIVAKYLAENED